MASKTKLLVDKVGRQNQFLQDYFRRTWDTPEEWWSDEQWADRKRVLLENTEQMDAELLKRNQSLEHYGWTLSRDAQWHRLDEPTPPCRSPVPIEDRFPEWFQPEPDQETLMDVERAPEEALSPWA